MYHLIDFAVGGALILFALVIFFDGMLKELTRRWYVAHASIYSDPGEYQRYSTLRKPWYVRWQEKREALRRGP